MDYQVVAMQTLQDAGGYRCYRTKFGRELIHLADHALQQDRHHRKAAQGDAKGVAYGKNQGCDRTEAQHRTTALKQWNELIPQRDGV